MTTSTRAQPAQCGLGFHSPVLHSVNPSKHQIARVLTLDARVTSLEDLHAVVLADLDDVVDAIMLRGGLWNRKEW